MADYLLGPKTLPPFIFLHDIAPLPTNKYFNLNGEIQVLKVLLRFIITESMQAAGYIIIKQIKKHKKQCTVTHEQ